MDGLHHAVRVVIAALTLVGAACGDASTGHVAEPSAEWRDLDVGGVTTMDAFAPPNASDLPVVVLLHGTGGDRSAMEPIARAVADDGAVAFIPSWPVIEEQASLRDWDDEPYRAQVEAVVCALRAARRVAPELGGDPDDLTLVGYSGGGMVGAAVAKVAEPPWDDITCDEDVSHVPRRFVGLAGDYVNRYQYGGVAGDRFRPFDPFALELDNSDLQVRLLHGLLDRNVEPEVSHAFAEHVAASGADVELLFVDAGHADLVRPETTAGRFVRTQIGELLAGGDGAFSDDEEAALLVFDDGCRFDGPEVAGIGATIGFAAENRTEAAAWATILLVSEDHPVPDMVAGVIQGSVFEQPDWVEHPVVFELAAGASGTWRWHVLEGRTWVPVCAVPPAATVRPGDVFSAARPDGTVARIETG